VNDSPLYVVKGDAEPEEIAALVAVLQAVGSAQVGPSAEEPRSEWAAHHRKLQVSFPSGPVAWRSSSLPRT